MAYNPLNPNGQATMANSQPIVIASNQTPVSVIGNLSVLGTVPVTQSTTPWLVQLSSGSVITGSSSVQVVGLMPSQSVSGVGIFNVNPTGNGSIIAILTNSSVAALQGTQPWLSQIVSSVAVTQTGNGSIVTVWKDSSVLAGLTSTNASVITVLQAPSIVGTYAEDAASASGDKGFFVMGVRNDTLASVTSNDGDYSSHVVGPSGEMIVANSPITKWWTAQTSVMYGTSVQAFAPQGTSIFTYITGINIANDSATFSRVKITGGLGSVLAWTVAPANGGSNINFVNGIRTGENSGVSASISGVSSVYVTMTGFISKT